MTFSRIAVVAVAIHLVHGSSVLGQLAHRKETLRGHSNVFVSVTIPASPEATGVFSLRKDSLERYILKQLSENGIKASPTFTDQTLVLEINIDLLKVIQSEGMDVFAFVSSIEALQAARLATNHQAALVTTWRITKFGAVTKAKKEILRESVVQNLKTFISDWRDAQKKREKDSTPSRDSGDRAN